MKKLILIGFILCLVILSGCGKKDYMMGEEKLTEIGEQLEEETTQKTEQKAQETLQQLEQEECLGEGDYFESFETEGKCCEGLKPIRDLSGDLSGNCIYPECPCFICTKCDDGNCGIGENKCNCPEDCE